MDIRTFVNLCHSTSSIPYDITKRHTKSISDENGGTRIVSEDSFKEELIENLRASEDEDHLKQYDIAKVEEGLVFLKIIENNKNADVAIGVLKALRENIGQDIKYYRTLDNDGWRKVVAMLKGYMEANINYNTDIIFPNKIEDRANTLLYLKGQYGLNVSVRDDGSIEIDGLNKLFSLLDERVCNMGGRYFIERLLSQLKYNPTAQRLILPKQSNTQNVFTKPSQMVPYNYMLNVGLKNLSYSGKQSCQNSNYYNNTVELFKKVCFATMEVQSYSIWDDVFHKDKTPKEYIRDLIFRESVFDLHQSSMKFIVKFIKHISKEAVAYDVKLPFPLSHFIKLVEYLVNFFDAHKFVTITKAQLKYRKIPMHEILTVLDFCSRPIAEFNENFCSPTDYDNVNYWFYPIAKIDDDKWLFLPKTIASRCLYEAFVNWIREKDKSVDQNIGTYMESFLEHQFHVHNIQMLSGDYEMNDKSRGECDGLIESSNAILLLEMKKKPLVRASRKGNEVYILIDIADSLLSSQVQNFRTSVALMNGTLKLKKGDAEYDIENNSKDIERITVSLFPFGDIQNRILLEQILRIYHGQRFCITTADGVTLSKDEENEIQRIKKSYVQMEKKQAELNRYLLLLNEEKPFFNCWFLDIEKILYLLEDVKTVEQFVKNLLSIKHICLGIYDFYNEYMYIKQMEI